MKDSIMTLSDIEEKDVINVVTGERIGFVSSLSAGVAGEPDGDAIELLDVVLDALGGGRHPPWPAPCADAVWVGGSGAPQGTTPRGT